MPEMRGFRNRTVMQKMEPIEWLDGKIRIVDQSRLPHQEVQLQLVSYDEVAEAIRTLRIRGAPLIGIAGAYGLALCAQTIEADSRPQFLTELRRIAEALASTRPTAVNLRWAIDRMLTATEAKKDIAAIKSALITEARAIHDEEREATRRLSHFGAELIEDGFVILTHCNAGSLATGGYGTALGVMKAAGEQGKNISVIATETRPLLQGARLTAYELMRDGIPVTLITDSMAGYVMAKHMVNIIIVGADRILKDAVVNKIGTFTLAVLARELKIPFYVAAPKSTFDTGK